MHSAYGYQDKITVNHYYQYSSSSLLFAPDLVLSIKTVTSNKRSYHFVHIQTMISKAQIPLGPMPISSSRDVRTKSTTNPLHPL